MYVAPMNPNDVPISSLQTGCFKNEFDSTYPIQLNGIISQAEFKESIDNINQARLNRTPTLVIGLLAALLLLVGMALFIPGGAIATNSRVFEFPVLVGVGLGIFVLGMIVLGVGCIVVQARASSRMQKAITTESAKYSQRSRPSSWRLHTTSYWSGTRNRRRRITRHYLVINIGNAGANGMYQAPPSSAFGRPQADAFCSACGAPRQVSAGKFCSSCGQTFNN